MRPSAVYDGAPAEQGLVLQLGSNPTTDYYLRSRFAGSTIPWRVADLREPPSRCDLLAPGRRERLWVVFCRYASPAWLKAIEKARPRLARVAVMIDDDLAAAVGDGDLPLLYRARVWRHHGRFAPALGRLASEIWASTGALAERYGASAVMGPIPEADPPVPAEDPPPLVIYHGGAPHRREREFVIEVARRVMAARPAIRFEVVGGRGDLPLNTTSIGETSWTTYRQAQAGRTAALALAPLWPTAVNAARAPVKIFDAARLGAAGLFVDAEPFRGSVRPGVDGILLPMAPEAWVDAIVGLIDDPSRSRALARAARARLIALRSAAAAFPPSPS